MIVVPSMIVRFCFDAVTVTRRKFDGSKELPSAQSCLVDQKRVWGVLVGYSGHVSRGQNFETRSSEIESKCAAKVAKPTFPTLSPNRHIVTISSYEI